MAAHNMKTAFCLPSGVNEEFPSNLMWQQHQQQHQKKNINQQQNNQFTSELNSKCAQEQTCAEVSF